eukprot:861095-Rhodomonas_salina.1
MVLQSSRFLIVCFLWGFIEVVSPTIETACSNPVCGSDWSRSSPTDTSFSSAVLGVACAPLCSVHVFAGEASASWTVSERAHAAFPPTLRIRGGKTQKKPRKESPRNKKSRRGDGERRKSGEVRKQEEETTKRKVEDETDEEEEEEEQSIAEPEPDWIKDLRERQAKGLPVSLSTESESEGGAPRQALPLSEDEVSDVALRSDFDDDDDDEEEEKGGRAQKERAMVDVNG